MGPSDDATDGEHPPVYLPSLSSGDNRGVMSKALKGSGVEKQQSSKIPAAAKKCVNTKGRLNLSKSNFKVFSYLEMKKLQLCLKVQIVMEA